MRCSIALILMLPAIAAPSASHAQPAMPRFGAPAETVVQGVTNGGGHMDVADVDGDGHPDAFLTNNSDSRVRVLLADAQGGFGVARVVDFSPGPYIDGAFALADFNRDGRSDVAVGLGVPGAPNAGAPNIGVRYGAADGSMGDEARFNNYPPAPATAIFIRRGLIAADFTGDGVPDLLSNTTALGGDPRLAVVPGDGAGGFAPPIASPQSQSLTTSGTLIVAGDIDGDGDLDALSFINSGSESRASTTAAVNLNDGSGVFSYAGSIVLGGKLTGAGGEARAFLTDLDGDGRADLVFYGKPGGLFGGGGIEVRLSNGEGTFRAGFNQPSIPSTETILVADMNGDGAPDILRFASSGPGSVLINDGHAGFGSAASFPAVAGFVRTAAAANVRGSRLPDVVMLSVQESTRTLRMVVVENTTPTPCLADFNGSGGVSVQDVFDFLAVYFSGSFAADFNMNGEVSVQDAFDFLGAYFIGCP